MKAVEQDPVRWIVRIVAAPVITQKIRTRILNKENRRKMGKKRDFLKNLKKKKSIEAHYRVRFLLLIFQVPLVLLSQVPFVVPFARVPISFF
jgi:hypothetical protein